MVWEGKEIRIKRIRGDEDYFFEFLCRKNKGKTKSILKKKIFFCFVKGRENKMKTIEKQIWKKNLGFYNLKNRKQMKIEKKIFFFEKYSQN